MTILFRHGCGHPYKASESSTEWCKLCALIDPETYGSRYVGAIDWLWRNGQPSYERATYYAAMLDEWGARQHDANQWGDGGRYNHDTFAELSNAQRRDIEARHRRGKTKVLPSFMHFTVLHNVACALGHVTRQTSPAYAGESADQNMNNARANSWWSGARIAYYWHCSYDASGRPRRPYLNPSKETVDAFHDALHEAESARV